MGKAWFNCLQNRYEQQTPTIHRNTHRRTDTESKRHTWGGGREGGRVGRERERSRDRGKQTDRQTQKTEAYTMRGCEEEERKKQCYAGGQPIS